MTKKTYHHGDLKTAILDAAEEILAEQSLDAVSMRELARKAGVSPGAPYHHFGDRSGLVGALCQRGFLNLHETLIKGKNHQGIKGMISAYLNFTNKNPALYQLMFSAEATEGDLAKALKPFANPVFIMLEETIKSSAPSKATHQDNLAAVSVWCFMHGLATLGSAAPLLTRVNPDNLNQFAFDTIQKLIQTNN